LLFGDVINSELLNDCPNETKDQLQVLINNILSRDDNEVNLLSLEEIEGEGNVLNLLDSDLWNFGVFGQGLIGNDLQELDEGDT